MGIFEILQKLNACHGASGNEDDIAAAIETMAAPYADECTRDALGNLIVHKKGNGPRVLFAAHMDTVGFVVTRIDDQGYLRVAALGDLNAAAAVGAPVRFRNGTRGVVAGEGGKSDSVDRLYIDLGVHGREDAEKLIQIGDTAVFDTPAFVSGDCVFSPYLDNRISCAVLLAALEKIRDCRNDLCFAFTVQEEVGLRGGRTAAYGVDPDFGIAVNVTDSDDIPAAPHKSSCRSGSGAAIKVMDSSAICDRRVVRMLEQVAGEHGIPVQREVLTARSTDAGAINQSRAGIRTSGIAVPVRYAHTPMEIADLRDVEAAIALTAAFAETDPEKI